MQSGAFEPEETSVVQALLNDVDVMVNIGANIGYYCCLAIGRKKQVIAFEPLPRNLEYLMRNLALNGFEDSVEIFPMALGSSCGIAKFFGGETGASLIPGWAGQSEGQLTLVPISTVDTILGTRLRDKRCLVIVDIEGAELGMLQGASSLIHNTPRPTWLVEISVNEHQPNGELNPNLVATFQLFMDAGYQAFTADQKFRQV